MVVCGSAKEQLRYLSSALSCGHLGLHLFDNFKRTGFVLVSEIAHHYLYGFRTVSKNKYGKWDTKSMLIFVTAMKNLGGLLFRPPSRSIICVEY